MESYDVIVIGGGPGGYTAAILAASQGLGTALVERDALGGACLNRGCIPTKSLLRCAEVVSLLRQGDTFGFGVTGLRLDYARAQERSRQTVSRLANGVEGMLRKNNVTVYRDTAWLAGPQRVRLGDGQALAARHIILATGAAPAQLPFLNYGNPRILDSTKALALEKVPGHPIIIGAGAIGMEFATIFSAYGAEVQVVEFAGRVLPGEDKDISRMVEGIYGKQGVRILTETTVTAVQERDGRVEAVATANGKTVKLAGDCILSAVGIRPNTAGLGLKNCGIEVDHKGFIPVDEAMRANGDVYAIGDISGKPALAHVATAQAKVAVGSILGKSLKPINYHNIPRCTYLTPEVASVGLSEEESELRGFHTGTTTFPMHANGKAVSSGDDRGFAKLVYNRTDGQLLGAHLCCLHATEMIWGLAGYIGMEMTMEEMAHVVHPHPTASEAILEAAHLAMGSLG